MFFTRTSSYQTSLTRDDLKDRLIGKHVRIHNLDFEVLEDEGSLSIIPHAEQEEAIKTLPITTVDLSENGGSRKVVITSKIRKLDLGGPILVLISCGILVTLAVVLYFVAKEPLLTYVLAGAGLAIFVAFWIRMQMGYFDYVRKVKEYVISKAALN